MKGILEKLGLVDRLSQKSEPEPTGIVLTHTRTPSQPHHDPTYDNYKPPEQPRPVVRGFAELPERIYFPSARAESASRPQ